MDRSDKVAKIIELRRKTWTREDIVDAYEDEWFDEIPEDLEECFEMMEDYIDGTYDDELIDEILENGGE